MICFVQSGNLLGRKRDLKGLELALSVAARRLKHLARVRLARLLGMEIQASIFLQTSIRYARNHEPGLLETIPHLFDLSGRVSRGQKMLRGHLPRAIYHHVYWCTKKINTPSWNDAGPKPSTFLRFFFIYLKPKVKWYKSLCALTTSPPRNR